MAKLRTKKKQKPESDLDIDESESPVEATTPAKERQPGKQQQGFYYSPDPDSASTGSRWFAVGQSVAVFKTLGSPLADIMAGLGTRIADAGLNKRAAGGVRGRLEAENSFGVPHTKEEIENVGKTEEAFRADQLTDQKTLAKYRKRKIRRDGKLEEQLARQIAYPNPRSVDFIGLPRAKFDREKVGLLRHEKIAPKIAAAAVIENRRPSLETVIDVRIPAEIRKHAARWGSPVGKLFARVESGERDFLPVPKINSYFSRSEGQVKQFADPLAFEAAHYPERLTKTLEEFARKHAAENELFVMGDDEAAKQLKKLYAELHEFERLEEAIIRDGERQGIFVLRRREASLEGVFGYEWKK